MVGLLATVWPVLQLAQTSAERRGQLVGMLLGSIVIMLVGLYLVRRNRRK